MREDGALRAAWRTPRGRAGLMFLTFLGLLSLVDRGCCPTRFASSASWSCRAPAERRASVRYRSLSRDVLSRVVSGARVSLAVAAIAVALSVTLGAAVGLVAGYLGGAVDAVLMRLVDGALAVPRLFLLMLVLAVPTRVPLLA